MSEQDTQLRFRVGDRVKIVGPNGIGETKWIGASGTVVATDPWYMPLVYRLRADGDCIDLWYPASSVAEPAAPSLESRLSTALRDLVEHVEEFHHALNHTRGVYRDDCPTCQAVKAARFVYEGSPTTPITQGQDHE